VASVATLLPPKHVFQWLTTEIQRGRGTLLPDLCLGLAGRFPRRRYQRRKPERGLQMKRFAYCFAVALAASMVLFTSVAAASLLSIAKARHIVAHKAAKACGGTCSSSGVRSFNRLSSKKVSAVAFVTTGPQTCTDKMVVTKTSTGGVKVKSDPYPAGWICTP
jgi:heme/copper-type cytochrome/quinol oxidase subunit 1